MENLSKVESKICPRFFFTCFPQFYSVLGNLTKAQIVCRGAKILFLRVVEVSKKGGSKNNSAFFVFVFFMLDKAKEKR